MAAEELQSVEQTPKRADRFALAGAAASLTNVVLGMVRSKLVALTIGAEGVGVVAEVSQLVSLLNVASALFGGAALLTWVSQSTRDNDFPKLQRGVGTALAATAATAAIAGATALVIAPRVLPSAWAEGATTFVALAAVAQLFTLLQSVVVHVHIGLGDLRATTMTAVLSTVSGTIASVVLVLLFGLEGQFWSLVVGGAASLAVGVVYFRRRPQRFALSPALDPSFLRFAAVAGTVMLISGYSSQLLLSSARYALESLGAGFVGAQYNGNFQAAWMIGSTYFGVLLGGVGNYFYPRFANARDGTELTAEIAHATRMALRYAPALAILAIAFRDVAVWLLYSGQFELAGEMLGYLLAGDIAKAVTWSYLGVLPMRGKVRALIIVEGVSATLGTTLFLAGANYCGPEGVAAAAFVLALTMSPVTALVAKKACGITIGWRGIFQGVALACLGVVVNWAIHLHWSMRVVATSIALGLLWRAGALEFVRTRLSAFKRGRRS